MSDRKLRDIAAQRLRDLADHIQQGRCEDFQVDVRPLRSEDNQHPVNVWIVWAEVFQ